MKVQSCSKLCTLFKNFIFVVMNVIRNFCVSIISITFRHPNTGMKCFYTWSWIWARVWVLTIILQRKVRWLVLFTRIKSCWIIFYGLAYWAKYEFSTPWIFHPVQLWYIIFEFESVCCNKMEKQQKIKIDHWRCFEYRNLE